MGIKLKVIVKKLNSQGVFHVQGEIDQSILAINALSPKCKIMKTVQDKVSSMKKTIETANDACDRANKSDGITGPWSYMWSFVEGDTLRTVKYLRSELEEVKEFYKIIKDSQLPHSGPIALELAFEVLSLDSKINKLIGRIPTKL